jgi:hypothetical protein
VRTTGAGHRGGGGLPTGLERGKGVAHGGKSRRVAPRLSAKAEEKKKDRGAARACA